MKLGNFSGLIPQAIELLCDKGSRLNKNEWALEDEVTLAYDAGHFVLQQGERIITVTPAKGQEELRIKAERGETLWTLTSIKGNRLYIRGVELAEATTLLDLDMGVTAFQTEQLFKRGDIDTDAIEAAVAWLKDEFILDGEEQPRLITALYAGNTSGSLEILGREWVATLREQDNYWTVDRLTRTKRRGAVLRILQGNIRFIDASAANQLKNTSYQQALSQSLQDHGSYIKLWNQYNDIEWAINLEAARTLGSLPFHQSGKGDGSRIWGFMAAPERVKAFLERWQEISGRNSGKQEMLLEVVSEQPDWLNNEQDLAGTGLNKSGKKPWLAELVKDHNGLITLKYLNERDRRPEQKGYICLSMHGYRVNRERRVRAMEHIQNKANPMPQLHYLLQGVEVPVGRTQRFKAITPAARARFKGEPTRKQKEALEVALRTPDIAIIIGPPGTGKTQVITALQARLAEEMKDQAIQHQMLITSFQHDAVDNVLERSDVFGLPAIKIGGKIAKKGDADNDPISSWCSSGAVSLDKSLDKLLAQEPAFDVIKELQKQLTVLRVSKPNYQEKAALISDINRSLIALYEHYRIRLTPDVQGRWDIWSEIFLNAIPAENREDNSFLQRHIRALRTTPEAYNDDGAIQCIRLLDACHSKKYPLNEDDKELLQLLSGEFSASLEQLARLKTVKILLLEQLIPDYRPRHVQEILSEEDCKLLSDIHNDINNALQAAHNLAYLNVLAEYQSALKHSPYMIRQAVEQYTSVLGATCQQAAGNPMVSLRQVDYQDQLSFDTVIVDEASGLDDSYGHGPQTHYFGRRSPPASAPAGAKS